MASNCHVTDFSSSLKFLTSMSSAKFGSRVKFPPNFVMGQDWLQLFLGEKSQFGQFEFLMNASFLLSLRSSSKSFVGSFHFFARAAFQSPHKIKNGNNLSFWQHDMTCHHYSRKTVTTCGLVFLLQRNLTLAKFSSPSLEATFVDQPVPWKPDPTSVVA